MGPAAAETAPARTVPSENKIDWGKGRRAIELLKATVAQGIKPFLKSGGGGNATKVRFTHCITTALHMRSLTHFSLLSADLARDNQAAEAASRVRGRDVAGRP